METEYKAHVGRLEADLSDLCMQVRGKVEACSAFGLRSRLFSRMFQLFSLTGELEKLRGLCVQIGAFRELFSAPSDLWLVQACIALKLHRFQDARDLVDADTGRSECPQGRLIRADLDVQAGEYSSAREQILLALEKDVTWDALARLAYLEGLLGDVEEADRLYLAAQDELSAKEMHAYAWIEVQRGVQDFRRGRYQEAEAHYRRAEKAYSGYWLVEERIAELDGARGSFDKAIAAYEGLYGWQSRPEWAHAMGDLYALRGDINSAHAWKVTARDGYLASMGGGGVHYLHALVDLCCEMPGQAEDAVRWAGMDESTRSNYQTQGNLAWALYRCYRLGEAERWIQRALQSSVVCGRLYLQAACIFAAAGRAQVSQRYFRLAKGFNALPAKAQFSELPGKVAIRVMPGLPNRIRLQQPSL